MISISLQHQHTHLMWTSRCRIVLLSKTGTFEEVLRQKAFSLLTSLRADSSQLGYRHRSLLNRNQQFFLRASLSTIQMWFTRVRTAVAYTKKQNQQLGADILNWILIRPHDPGKSERGVRIPKRRRLRRLQA